MTPRTEIAIFGGGCFWCTEAVFKMLKGVSSVLPGYAGGTTPNPTYDQVCAGATGHAEVTRVEFDPKTISYDDLLTVFFATHDPTTLNRQGNDVGTQYRSVIFYTTEDQKRAAEQYVADLNRDLDGKVVTKIKPLEQFYSAENYHQDYFAKNPDNPYCNAVINPKLAKVKQKFVNLLSTFSHS